MDANIKNELSNKISQIKIEEKALQETFVMPFTAAGYSVNNDPDPPPPPSFLIDVDDREITVQNHHGDTRIFTHHSEKNRRTYSACSIPGSKIKVVLNGTLPLNLRELDADLDYSLALVFNDFDQQRGFMARIEEEDIGYVYVKV